jgi:hypothetical protein
MDALTDRRHIEQAYAEFSRVVSEGGTPLQRMVGYQGGNELADLLWFEVRPIRLAHCRSGCLEV